MTYNDTHAECLIYNDLAESRFYFPFLYVENKRASKSFRQALHQCQMYCIFGDEFLGINDIPVFGDVTAGTDGEIIVVRKSSKSAEADYRVSYPAEKVTMLYL